MKKIYFVALICFLPITATSAFACGGEDEEACAEESQASDNDQSVTVVAPQGCVAGGNDPACIEGEAPKHLPKNFDPKTSCFPGSQNPACKQHNKARDRSNHDQEVPQDNDGPMIK